MSIRIVRVQHDLQRALGLVFLRNNMMHVAIRNIYMSKDLRGATVEVDSLDETITNEQMIKQLEARVGFIKRELRGYINFKYFPNLKFALDSHKARMDAVEKIMEQIAAENKEENKEEEQGGE